MQLHKLKSRSPSHTKVERDQAKPRVGTHTHTHRQKGGCSDWIDNVFRSTPSHRMHALPYHSLISFTHFLWWLLRRMLNKVDQFRTGDFLDSTLLLCLSTLL